MSGENPVEYDVFVSYSSSDRAWVEDWLLPRLEQAGFRVGVRHTAFTLGAPFLTNIEQAFQASHRVILVLTPDWLSSELGDFEATLLRSSDPAARRRKLLPLLLKPCELPEAITALKLEQSNFTDQKNWEREFKRLRRDIVDTTPIPFPPPQGRGADLRQWSRWLRHNRRKILRGVLLAFAIWLISSSLLQVPPFEPRLGWQALGLKVKDVERLVRAGDTLLVSTATDFLGCDVADTGDTGLWRSTDQGRVWNAIVVNELVFNRPGQGCVLAAITAFAQVPTLPGRIYASTSDAGLLRSDDAGEHWMRVGEDSLPDKRLRTVAVTPAEPYTVWAAAEKVGLYRWQDNENQWQPVNGAETCVAGALGETDLPRDLSVGVILTTANTIYIGTHEKLDQPGSISGIYRSRDGGNCWLRIDNAQERYSYIAIAEMPNTADGLVVLALDHNVVSGRDNHQLFVLEGEKRRTPGLWETGHAVNRLYVDAGPPPAWYVISALGEIYRGPVAARGSEGLPKLRRCFLPPTCSTDFAPDFKPGPPLVLANDQVYRLAQVSWWQSLWP